MDEKQLIKGFIDFLQHGYSALHGVQDAAAEALGAAIGKAAWKKTCSLWGRLRERVMAREDGPEALESAAQSEATDRFAELEFHLQKILRKDVDLAEELAGLMPALHVGLEQMQVENDAMVAVGSGNTQLKESILVGGNLSGGVHIQHSHCPLSGVDFDLGKGTKREKVNLDEAVGAYLEYLFQRYSLLELKGLGFSDGVGLRLPLLKLYIPLQARMQQPDGETWSRELMFGGRQAGKEEQEAMGDRLSKSMPLRDILHQAPGLVILGDPGSGKTTFLKYLCLMLACGKGAELGLQGYLPVLVPLSAYAQDEKNSPLEDFIPAYYGENIGGGHPLGAVLRAALAEGRALMLLDGLDEVRDPVRRRSVVEGIENFFANHKHKGIGNRLVLTSRIIGYPEVQLRQEGIAECFLADFDNDDIHDFIDKWTEALEQALLVNAPEQAAAKAAEEKRGLRNAMENSEGVRKLAANPLLLTILCLMKREGIELPERRVELYQKYVDTLIHHWNLGRCTRHLGQVPPDLLRTRNVLAPLALWMQQTSPGVGLVQASALNRELERILAIQDPDCDPEQEAERFMEDLRSWTALLLYRGGKHYGFIHLTFQEYLAAVALARQGQKSIDPVYDALVDCLDKSTWREVWLLTLGYLSLIQGREEASSEIVERLIAAQPGKPGEALIRAGEVLLDMGSLGVTPYCWQQTLSALREGLDDPKIPAKKRVQCARLLGALGDIRMEVLSPDAMPFCWVPEGPFTMGSDDDLNAYSREKPSRLQPVDYGYWLARWPVTTAQFSTFVAAEGYQKHDPDSLNGPPGAPVAHVNWHDAVAFCRWLEKRWQDKGWLPAGYHVVLPSELEWEKAARGGEMVPDPANFVACAPDRLLPLEAGHKNRNSMRVYPWGDKPDLERANYNMHIGEVSPVGCYPLGAGPYGCEEMAGNVWEWTRSLWEKYPYPETEKERRSREDLAADGRRVLRGGGFYLLTRRVRCAARSGAEPGDRSGGFGFRVVLSPFPLDSEASDL